MKTSKNVAAKNQVTKEIADMLKSDEAEAKLTVTQKFSQARGEQGSSRPGSQLLDKHYAGYGGTNS